MKKNYQLSVWRLLGVLFLLFSGGEAMSQISSVRYSTGARLTPVNTTQRLEPYALEENPESSVGVTIYGCLLDSYGDYWMEPGIFSVNTATPSIFTEVAPGIKSYGGATIVEDKYYSIYYREEGSLVYFPIRLTVYDATTFEAEKEYASATFTAIATDLAYDHTTKKIYGCFQNGDYSAAKTFGYLVFNESDGTYNSEPIAELPERMMALTTSRDGTLYAVSQTGRLYTINKTTGQTTLIRDLAIGANQWGYQSMCYDQTRDKIYWAGQNSAQNNCLFEIDPATGEITQLIDYWSDTETYDQLVGCFIKQEFDEVVIPSPATDLRASFADSSLSGELTFTLPTEDIIGNALPNNLQYEVTLDNQPLLTGSGTPGAVITEPVEVSTSGMYTIVVTVSLDGVKSEKAQIDHYIGQDVPKAPSDVKAVRGEVMTDGRTLVTISWSAPTRGQHGGTLDLTALTYSVTRQPDGVVVASGISTTSITDYLSFDLTEAYYYEVVATIGTLESPSSQSNEVTSGFLSLPYNQDFEAEDSFDQFSVVDANRDGSTWFWQDGYAVYEYNAKNPANDWLMTPAFKMKSTKQYVLEFTAINSYPTERIAAYVGSAPTVEAMSIEVIAPTEITADEQVKTVRGTFRPQTDGVYHFGIKAMSDADMSTLYVDNLTITEMSASVPEAVTELQVVAGERGALRSTISFKTPDKCVDGTNLESVDLQIVRDGFTIKELSGVGSGEFCSFEDTQVSEGSHLYVVIPSNPNGLGNKAETKVYIGVDIPGKVRNLKAVEDLNEEGTVILTWEAPEYGQNGGYVDPDQLTYYISKGVAGAGDINNGNATTYRDKLDISKGQAFEGYNIYATNDKGSGRNVWQTVVALAGPAVQAPMIESLSGMKMKSGPWLTEMIVGEIGEAYWNPVDGVYQMSGTQDNDGGLWVFETTAIGKSCKMMSPKVDISQLDHPEVSFYIFNTGNNDKLDVTVSRDFGDDEPLGSLTLDGEAGWQRYHFDLTPYKSSRFVRIGFTGTSLESTTQIISFDNVAITEQAEINLQLLDFTQPEKSYVGQPATFLTTIRNSGSSDLEEGAYTIDLYKNDKLVAQAEGLKIKRGAQSTLSVEDIPTPGDKAINEYYIYINCLTDEYTVDNTSQRVAVELIFNEYPTPTHISASQGDNSVKLQWQSPDMSAIGSQVTTDSFEDYEQFAIIGFGDWSIVDNDGLPTIQIALGDVSGPLQYPHAGEPMAFQVFNSMEAGIPFTSWTPHTGEQMLVAFKCASPDQGQTEVTNDDWLISPELNGEEQTISLYAKAGMTSAYQPEKFQVLYSQTGVDIHDFKQVGETVELYNVDQWQEFKFTIPSGSKYFAIRCVSEAKFAMLLDDISYIPLGAKPEELTLLGYNVYRDDVKQNETLLTSPEFVDNQIEQDRHYVYHVTAIYDKGESRYSDACSVTTGVALISLDDLVISSVFGGIMIMGAEDAMVDVFDASGVRVYSGDVTEQSTIPLPAGVYIVTIGDLLRKVVVK